MAENMLKFLRGNVANLPQTATPGALYFTKDEGVYLGLENGTYHRYGDFITVADVKSLPATGAHETCMYYCTSENILARYDSVKGWIQINKQPTAEELKTLLGLGSLAYLSEVSEDNLNAALKEKVNAAAEGNHSHNNKALLDTYTQTEENLADAVAKKHAHTFNETELNKIVEGDVAKWNAAEGNAKAYVDEKIEALDYTDTAVAGEYVSAVNEVDGKISVTRVALPDYTNTYDAKGAAATAESNAKAYADGLASNYDAKGTAAGVKSELEVEIGKKVDKVEGKSLVLDTEITKLAGVSEGANKVEGSTVNGNIKIDGVETVVYTHPEKHAIADVTGLQDALDGKQAAGNYSEVGHKHVKADITDFAHTHVASEITDLDATIKGYDYATKTELGEVDAKFADYVKTSDYNTYKEGIATELGNRYTKEEADGKFAIKGADAYDDTELAGRVTVAEGKIADLETESAKHAIKTEVEDALALKADKSVVEAMYTNTQIDGFIAEAKKYADDNDANTTYTIGYESKVEGESGHPARIVLTPSEGEVQYVDATPFIKDGMISNVTINEANDLVITFNTDAGKDAIEIPLDEFIDVYTGSTGARVTVGVEGNVISADLVAGSIGKDYLDAGVKASLGLADTALQAHQDISHLATKEELNGVDAKFANYNTTVAQKAIDDAQDARIKAIEDDYLVEADIANFETKENVKKVSDDLAAYVESNNAAVALKANSADVYNKTETYTKEEVEALIEQAHTWGSF